MVPGRLRRYSRLPIQATPATADKGPQAKDKEESTDATDPSFFPDSPIYVTKT